MDKPETFDDADAQRAWDLAANAWDAFVESGADYYRHEVHGPALLAMCQPVAGLDVLDLGCGQGYFSRELARCGARVVGIDVSVEQIAFARQHEKRHALSIEYHVMPVTDASRRWGEPCYDLLTACMAVQDMGDVPAAFRSAFAVLRHDGRMVFSIPHPCTDTPVREWELDEAGNKTVLKIGKYFETGPSICHWRMERLLYHWDTPYHRYTLSEWSEMASASGFSIRRIAEPRPSEEQVRVNPRLADCRELPYFLLLELGKTE